MKFIQKHMSGYKASHYIFKLISIEHMKLCSTKISSIAESTTSTAMKYKRLWMLKVTQWAKQLSSATNSLNCWLSLCSKCPPFPYKFNSNFISFVENNFTTSRPKPWRQMMLTLHGKEITSCRQVLREVQTTLFHLEIFVEINRTLTNLCCWALAGPTSMTQDVQRCFFKSSPLLKLFGTCSLLLSLLHDILQKNLTKVKIFQKVSGDYFFETLCRCWLSRQPHQQQQQQQQMVSSAQWWHWTAYIGTKVKGIPA